MRKKLYILSLLLCIVLVSCTPTSEPIPTPNPPSTPAATEAPSKKADEDIIYSTIEVSKRYYNDVGGFVDLELRLPQIEGNYQGISEINNYFLGKEAFFYDELPLDLLKEESLLKEGAKDNYFRSADYHLTAKIGDVISLSADLDGGAGGVSWAGIEGNTFDLNTGKKLSLSDIFTVDEEKYMDFIYEFIAKSVREEIKDSLEQGYGSPYNFDDPYTEKGREAIRGFAPNDFYLTEDSLVIFYQKYAISSGAAGPQTFAIPYQDMADMLIFD